MTNKRNVSSTKSVLSAATEPDTGSGDPIRRGVFYALDALTPHPDNYNKHSERQIMDLCASLADFGQVRDIVVWPHLDHVGALTTYIIGGEGLWTAAGRKDWPGLSCTVLPTWWTYAKAKAYLIADNTHGRNSDPDMIQLAAMLEEQSADGFNLAALGYSEDDLSALLVKLNAENLMGDGTVGDDDDPPTFDDIDESLEDDLPTEMCTQCGKLCLKPKRP